MERKKEQKRCRKKQYSTLVVYHNDLSDMPLAGFSANEQDFFMAVCLQCKNKGNDIVNMTFDEARALMQYKRSKKRFVDFMTRLNVKLLDITVLKKSGTRTEGYKLFQAFRIDEESEVITMQVSEPMQYILTTKTNFTNFQLPEFREIVSRYAKGCYRQLERYRDTGIWMTDLDNFKRLIDYEGANQRLVQTVIPTIIKDLDTYFEDLVFEAQYGSGRGRPIIGYRITFKPQPHRSSKEAQRGFICPKCGRPLIEKVINGSNCWCHEDGWKENAKCSAIYNTIAQVKGYEELPAKHDDGRCNIEAAEAEDNIKKLKECYAFILGS